jgi:hypothetical protein
VCLIGMRPPRAQASDRAVADARVRPITSASAGIRAPLTPREQRLHRDGLSLRAAFLLYANAATRAGLHRVFLDGRE